jgi:hypothetical protein
MQFSLSTRFMVAAGVKKAKIVSLWQVHLIHVFLFLVQTSCCFAFKYLPNGERNSSEEH